MAALTDGKEMAVNGVKLADVTVSYQAALALGASNRHIRVACPGARVGDTLSFRSVTGFPDGYNVGACFCAENDFIIVVVSHPALVLGQKFDISGPVIRVMA